MVGFFEIVCFSCASMSLFSKNLIMSEKSCLNFNWSTCHAPCPNSEAMACMLPCADFWRSAPSREPARIDPMALVLPVVLPLTRTNKFEFEFQLICLCSRDAFHADCAAVVRQRDSEKLSSNQARWPSSQPSAFWCVLAYSCQNGMCRSFDFV